eukprot:8874036-Pyramimonas_sp.AAC.1
MEDSIVRQNGRPGFPVTAVARANRAADERGATHVGVAPDFEPLLLWARVFRHWAGGVSNFGAYENTDGIPPRG